MKKQTKKAAATPAKSKGKAKPTANAETVAPVPFKIWMKRVRRIFTACGDTLDDVLPVDLERRPADDEPPPQGFLDAVRAWCLLCAEVFKLRGEEAKIRASLIRKVAGWIRGDATPPDGATRADVTFRGLSWEGWLWNLRGSPLTVEDLKTNERDALNRWHGLIREERNERKTFHEVFPPLIAAREAAAGFVTATREERAAWKEIIDAADDALGSLSLEELAAAQKRTGAGSALWVHSAKRELASRVPLEESAPPPSLDTEGELRATIESLREVAAKIAPPPPSNPATGADKPADGARMKAGARGVKYGYPLKNAAADMKRSVRTLSRWLSNPELVPDEYAGFSAAALVSESAFTAWKMGLGLRDSGANATGKGASRLIGDGWQSMHTVRRS